MAVSSQGEDEEEERRVLERELAEELALLSATDVGFDECVDHGYDRAGWMSNNEELEMDYVRLDLDKVLQQVSKTSSDDDELQELSIHNCENDLGIGIDQQVPTTAWELLLQSVERIDRDFFHPIHEDLYDIRASILDAKPPPRPSQLPNQKDVAQPQMFDVADRSSPEFDDQLLEQSNMSAVVESNDGSVNQPNNAGDIEAHLTVQEKKTIASSSDADCGVGQGAENIEGKIGCSQPCQVDHCAESPNTSGLVDVVTSSSPDQQYGIVTDAESEHTQKDLDAIAKQHAARESRRLKLEARHQKEREDAAQLLKQLQEEYEAQEKDAEEARREAFERSAMANEESRCQLYAAAMREFQETMLMDLADKTSQKFAVELARIQDAICQEVVQMAIEDQAERQRMQHERQLLLLKQEALARCHFSALLIELVQYQHVQRQVRDQLVKRERRECVQMRAEEAYTRRIIIESRALCELQAREENRTLMAHEDELARVLEDFERTRRMQAQERLREKGYCHSMEEEEQRCHSAWAFSEKQRQFEERSQISMKQEEERCRSAWTYVAKVAEEKAHEREKQREHQRLRRLADVGAGFQKLDRSFQRHKLVQFLGKWTWWYTQLVEDDRVKSIAAEDAAKRIQMWHRSCRSRREQVASVESALILEDFSEGEEQPQVEDEDEGSDNEIFESEEYAHSAESQQAARRLQSTFRGFHVRRKFANAIALAQAVGEPEEGGDSFDAVDLDDLIELPPELVDGWEDPVLPAAVNFAPRQYLYPPCAAADEEERPEHADNNELEDTTRLENRKNVKAPVSSVPADNNPPKEHNLAATLWNKMKRAKQRQQHAQQERKRQQDPSYRVQKLLHRKSTAHQASTQNGHVNTSNQSSHAQKTTSTVSWSSTSNQKKKPKVKLPSLVERLRRQTMAER